MKHWKFGNVKIRKENWQTVKKVKKSVYLCLFSI